MKESGLTLLLKDGVSLRKYSLRHLIISITLDWEATLIFLEILVVSIGSADLVGGWKQI